MEGRSKLHDKISDLLATLENNNNRLSLHEERISQLDIDVLRKQCIDLYDQINRLALSGPLESGAKPEAVKVVQEPVVEEEIEMEVPSSEVPVQETVKPTPKVEVVEKQVQPAEKKSAGKEVQQDEPKSIHMKLQDEAEMVSLFEKFNSKPIDNIGKAINISKRFEFQNNFFDGDAASYKSFIAQLDDAGEREAAFQVYHKYKEELGWSNEELKDELKSLLYRKYAT